MKVFVFDLLAHGENLDHLKNGAPGLPYPLSKQHVRADVERMAENMPWGTAAEWPNASSRRPRRLG